jgi:hypothetical protein
MYKNYKAKNNDKIFELYSMTNNNNYLNLYQKGWTNCNDRHSIYTSVIEVTERVTKLGMDAEEALHPMK